MEQIVDLQDATAFNQLGVALLSIAFDSSQELATVGQEYGTRVPLLTDTDHSVSEAYGVLRWAVGTGEPGHTFVLVDKAGEISWLQDYGAPENRGVMYVPVVELTQEVKARIGG